MTAIPFVDAHMHLWNLAHLRYPWLTAPFTDAGPNGSVELIAEDYGPIDYQRDASRWNLAGAVHVEAGATPEDALAETEWLEMLAYATGLPTVIVACAALNDPAIDALLAAQAAHRRVRGIRHIINWHADRRYSYTPRDVTQDAAWQSGFGLLSKHGLSFDLQCYPGQMPALTRLIERHDDTQVILNHAGMPVLSDPTGLDDWRGGMRMLATLPNVAVKLSGFGFADRRCTLDTIRALILETIDLFGVDRCLFASDLPTDKLFGSFDWQLDAYRGAVADFSENERRALFGRTANRLYRMGLALEQDHG